MITKIFLDSADPNETKSALELYPELAGQTTNPSLVAKNPQVQAYKQQKGAFSLDALLGFYKETVQEIAALLPHGSVSIEVPASASSTVTELCQLAHTMFGWIPNAHIKFPITTAGLEAAKLVSAEGIRVNMTLCFSQEQAAAVYQATATTIETLKGYKNVFVSPFIGRLDDQGEKGLDLICNIQRMYDSSDHHVALLAASVRSVDHLRALLAWNVDMATIPLAVLSDWIKAGQPMTQGGAITKLRAIPYQALDLKTPDASYNIQHPLTDRGLEKFTVDWEQLLHA